MLFTCTILSFKLDSAKKSIGEEKIIQSMKRLRDGEIREPSACAIAFGIEQASDISNVLLLATKLTGKSHRVQI